MKFVILFLAGLCAFSASASPIDIAKLELFEFDSLNIANHSLADETGKFAEENIAEYVKIMDMYYELDDEIQKETDKALAGTDKALAKEIALRGIKECVTDVLKDFVEFTEKVNEKSGEFTYNTLRLRYFVIECYNQDGSINTIDCQFQSIDDTKDLIVKIIQDLKKLVESFSNQSKNVIESIKNCKENNV